MKLNALDRNKIAHYLHQHDRLHNPSINRLFWTSAVDARSRRADVCTREYIGFIQRIQGHYESDFNFVLLSDPLFGYNDNDQTQSTNANSNEVDPLYCETQENHLKTAISSINKLRPRYY